MSEIRFDPQTGEPIAQAPAPKKGKGGKIAAAVIAAAVVIGGGAFAIKNLGGGGGIGKGTPYEQIKAASEATFVSDGMTDQFKAAKEIMEDGAYAVDASVDVSGQTVKVEYNTEKGNLSAKVSAAGLSGTVYMDDEKLTLDASSLGIDPLSYNYASDKEDAADSYVGSMVGTESLKQVDALLKIAHTAASIDKGAEKETEKLVDEKFETLEYEELEEETIEVGDEEVTCGGYSTTVTGEFLADLLDEVSEKQFGKSMTDLYEELSELGVTTAETDDVWASVKEMEDIDLKFYLNDGKIAQINLVTTTEDQDVDVSISFAGEDIPWHDMIIVNNEGGQTATLKAHEDGDVITYELADDEETAATVEYDQDSGDFTVYSGDEEVLKGSIESGKDDVTIKVDEVSGESVDAEVVISDDAKVEDAPESQDILSMSETDFSKLGSIISQLMYGL